MKIDNKGFTLVELIVVIGLITILSLLIIPNGIKILDRESDKALDLQKKQVKEATLLLIEDYCENPISFDKICPFSKALDNSSGLYKYNGQIGLETLISQGYIEPVFLKDKECSGTIVINNGKINVTLTCE